MARTLSTQLAAAVGRNGGYAFPTVRLKFAEERTLYLSSSAIQFDEVQWEPQIVSVGSLKASQGRATDRGSVSLKNTDFRWTQNEFALDSDLVGLRAIVGEAFFDDFLRFQGEVILLRGEVEDVTEVEETVELQIVSDLSARRGVVGGRLVAPRCQYLYKGPECGYTGPLQICDKKLIGADGCTAHGIAHRFGGATYLDGLSGARSAPTSVAASVSTPDIQGNPVTGGGVGRIDLSRFQMSVL